MLIFYSVNFVKVSRQKAFKFCIFCIIYNLHDDFKCENFLEKHPKRLSDKLVARENIERQEYPNHPNWLAMVFWMMKTNGKNRPKSKTIFLASKPKGLLSKPVHSNGKPAFSFRANHLQTDGKFLVRRTAVHALRAIIDVSVLHSIFESAHWSSTRALSSGIACSCSLSQASLSSGSCAACNLLSDCSPTPASP